jgi:iron complex outermembrane receptor protein
MIVDGGERGGRHAFASVGVPIVGALSLGLSGDYGDGGGYQLIKPGTGGPIDGISQAIVRNGSARLEYAPSSDISGFVTGHLFSDNRGLGTPMTKSWRTDGSTDAGLNIGHAETGYLTVRGWWRGMTENSVGATALTVATVPRAGERLSATATIPSQDRGVALAWTRAHLLGFESISLGGDYRFYGGYYNEQAYANNAANLPTTLIKSGGEQLLSGAFISGLLAPADAWRIELSARVDRWGNNNGYVTDASGTTNFANATRTAFSPRVGVRYELTKSLSFHTAAYQAFRAPNLAELYRRQVSATTVSLPNPDLKPEFATGYEGGVSWQPASWLQVKGTVYRAVYKDFNTFVTTSATGVVPATRQRQNVQGARSLGGEAYVALRPIEGLTISGSLNYNDSQMTDLGPIAPSAVTFVGARVARVPTQKSTERISYESRTLGTFTLLGRTESVVTTFGNAFTLPAYKIADASYSRPLIGGASVFMSLENIFNAEYLVSLSGAALSPVTSLGLPRTFRMGLEIARF